MIPSQQRLESHDATALERDDRLVVKRKLVAVHPPSEIGLETMQRKRAFVHGAVEHFVAGMTGRFGSIHCQVGIPDDFLGPVILHRAERDTDTGRGVNLVTVDNEHLAQELVHSLGHVG